MPKRQKDSDMDDPKEFAAWAFAAGIPDPRYKNLTFNQLIPAPCFAAISEMLWNFGFRHHPELQTAWVPEYAGADRNLLALGVTDVNPENVVELAAEMVADQFPDVAQKIMQMNPENREQMVRDQAVALLASVERLKQATSSLDQTWQRGDSS